MIFLAWVGSHLWRPMTLTMCDWWSAGHAACARIFLGIRLEETGARPAFPALYAVKHESFYEAISLPWLFDYPTGFAKKELFAIPGWGRAARVYGAIPVARDEGARALMSMVREVRPNVAEGRSVVIFPEGTRVPHGQRPRLQSGFAALYKLLGLPVVPVAVDSGPLYQRKWKRPGTIRVHFGEPIEPGLDRREIERRVHEGINRLNEGGAAQPAN
ncbi:1-acyl-sn-glycerol-3-phosphate acyltransferase [Aurantiacibacter spongiae]|uniref:1-acyl-sn-glycerol-3-phosphate acyltransferase n=2 Tax=Aurantiacibacter spongiae TaxID=2488860 RepID=A0A3N5CU17_9SPHN|nr:1-acyl-sn-glycerol-3-phosphate acyltransferase [Aurantiacibacter spongiae]